MRINVDTQSYKEKPVDQMGAISSRTRTAASVKDVTPAELIRLATNGYTFTPAELNGASKTNWQSQQVIVVDIDNDTERDPAVGDYKKICRDNPLTPAQALEILKQHSIKPLFLYKTFSYKPEWERFRIVCTLDTALKEVDKAMDYTRRLAALFTGTDYSIATPERMILGGKKDSLIYSDPEATNTEEVFKNLPEAPVKEKPIIDQSEIKPLDILKAKSISNQHRTQEELKKIVEDQIGNFDMASFVEKYAGCRLHKVGQQVFANPCPICGHNDDFAITGPLFHCLGKSGGDLKGNIITLLAFRNKLDTPAAMELFKYDLMGHNREEWDSAYKEKRNVEKMEEAAKREEQQTEDIKSKLEANTAAQVAASLNEYVKDIRPIPTGFTRFDEQLGGGLFAGLYTIGAISSLGKTSFCLQLADQLAARGNNVAIFSLEMTPQELVAKSISRTTYELAMERYKASNRAKTTRGILTGANYEKYDNETKQLIKDATEEYRQYAKNIWIFHNEGSVSTQHIEEQIQRFVIAYGKAPIVFVDYLQIIGSPEPEHNLTDKQITDKNVTALRKMSLKFNTPIITISSFNRSNYENGAGLASFKESGSVEYSADVLLGLQYAGMDGTKDAKEIFKEVIEKQNKGEDVEIQVKILKSRNGARGNALLYFNAMFNRFTEDKEYSPDELRPVSRTKGEPDKLTNEEVAQMFDLKELFS